MRRFTTVLAFAFAALATPAVADELSQSIPITQADRQDPAAATALYTRVVATAKSLCAKANPETYSYPQYVYAARAACERTAVDRAVSSAGLPALMAIHAEKLAQQASASGATTLAER